MKMKEENNYELPFQVQTLITTLGDKTERVYIRSNYRMRLDTIRKAIDRALLDYDIEMGNAPPKMYFPKGKR